MSQIITPNIALHKLNKEEILPRNLKSLEISNKIKNQAENKTTMVRCTTSEMNLNTGNFRSFSFIPQFEVKSKHKRTTTIPINSQVLLPEPIKQTWTNNLKRTDTYLSNLKLVKDKLSISLMNIKPSPIQGLAIELEAKEDTYKPFYFSNKGNIARFLYKKSLKVERKTETKYLETSI